MSELSKAAQDWTASKPLKDGVARAEGLAQLQLEAARRLLLRNGIAGTDQNLLVMAQIVATTWAGMD